MIRRRLFENNALIGTNGIESLQERAVGPQPLPPGILPLGILPPVITNINTFDFKPMSLPRNSQNNGLFHRIVLGADYFEQYWKYNGNQPIYLLQISPRYNVASKEQASYSNGNTTYTHPAMFIPLKEKHLYTPLWDQTANSGYQFDVAPDGFVARPT
jgi:hypothetical protein